MVNLYILLLYIYLVYALSYFFLWKNANNMCNWCCPREEKIWMFCFYSLLVMYIHCGLLKEYTAYSIFKIPLLIILVLNHWFNFFFFSKQYLCHFGVLFWSWSQKPTFSNFFLYWRSILKAIFLETWPSTLNGVVTLTFHLPFILFDLAHCSKLKYLHGWDS